MKTRKPGATGSEIAVSRLDDNRYALSVDGIVRYAGSREECERRFEILMPKNDRATQDEALARLGRSMR
jgi:hypothetical protein